MKKWYKSKTILLNSIAGFFGILPEVLSVIDVNLLHLMGVSDPARYYGLIGALTTVLNIFLRARSSKPSAPIKTAARVKKLKETNAI